MKPYARLDVDYSDHPKVAALSDAAFRLHTAGILYCARHLTDGLIATDEIPRLVRRYRKTALTELTDRALWVPVLGGAYAIHDYLDWNDTAAKVAKRRDTARRNGRRKWEL